MDLAFEEQWLRFVVRGTEGGDPAGKLVDHARQKDVALGNRGGEFELRTFVESLTGIGEECGVVVEPGEAEKGLAAGDGVGMVSDFGVEAGGAEGSGGAGLLGLGIASAPSKIDPLALG